MNGLIEDDEICRFCELPIGEKPFLKEDRGGFVHIECWENDPGSDDPDMEEFAVAQIVDLDEEAS